MKRRSTLVGLVACSAALSLADARAGTAQCVKTYLVRPAKAPAPRIDGVLEAREWPAESWDAEMTFPWREKAAPATAFSLQADDEALYFAFRVVDEDVVIIEGSPDDESLVARGDRVEMFFARDGALKEYYSLEIDPRARVLDYQASFYRRFDRGWDFPGLEVAARQRPDGYDVEGRLPFGDLESMGLALSPDEPLLAGVFRGEFSHGGSGDIDESWISWVRPDAEEPDFHIPSSFGCLRLQTAE